MSEIGLLLYVIAENVIGSILFGIIGILGLIVAFFPVFIITLKLKDYIISKLSLKHKEKVELIFNNETIKFIGLLIGGAYVWLVVPIVGSYILIFVSEYLGLNF
jgi:hypothetical protein